MLVVTVKFVLKDGNRDEFMPLVHENAKSSLSLEPGCRRFDVCTSPSQPQTVFLYEIYEDQSAFETHKTMQHYLGFSADTEHMVTSKIVETYILTAE